jgi:hypothetical protein
MLGGGWLAERASGDRLQQECPNEPGLPDEGAEPSSTGASVVVAACGLSGRAAVRQGAPRLPAFAV